MLSNLEIEEVLNQFDVDISNFDVVNIEEKKGWSSVYLYLIVQKETQYLLKGKSKEQLAGYMADIIISDYLASKDFLARVSIRTKSGDYHFVEGDIHWELKTYIPGAVVPFESYTQNSIVSLAKVNLAYINASLNLDEVNNLKLRKLDILDSTEIQENITENKSVLSTLIGTKPIDFLDWIRSTQEILANLLLRYNDFCIVHNDLNNRNILLDLETNNVISFIDWDHGCIANPLKDIIEPINNFFDYSEATYPKYRTIYLETVADYYDLKLNQKELDLLQLYLYGLNKWKYILLFAKWIKELGNSTNELTRFENEIIENTEKFDRLARQLS